MCNLLENHFLVAIVKRQPFQYNLTNNNLSVGQVLKISEESANIPDDNNQVIYIVKSGDNLYSIAKKYGVTIDEIINLNNLSSNLLSIGMQLKIPIRSNIDVDNQYGTYIVQSGDTLYSLAKKFDMSVNIECGVWYAPFMVSVPGKDADGWQYDVLAEVKHVGWILRQNRKGTSVYYSCCGKTASSTDREYPTAILDASHRRYAPCPYCG